MASISPGVDSHAAGRSTTWRRGWGDGPRDPGRLTRSERCVTPPHQGDAPPPSQPHGLHLRSLVIDLFLPHTLMAIGQGASAPVIALVAIDLGASVATAGFIVGLFALGALLGDIPAGILVSRVGDRRIMGVASAALGVAALSALTRPSLAVFAVLVTLMGTATSMFGLARLVTATELTPVDQRGRVMSTIGGTQRVGLLAGPIVGGLAIGPLGVAGPFLVHGALAIVASLVVFGSPTPASSPTATAPPPRIVETLREHRRTLATAGLAIVAFQIVRGSRQAIIPLWGSSLGLDARQIGILFSLSAAAEVVMFYPVGRMMDRRGRRSTAIPSLALLSIGVAAIPLTTDFLTLAVAVAVVGFANGLGTGINMTLSSDLSPDHGRGVFLGIWRTITDAGTASGPTLVGVVASVATLSLAGAVVSLFGFGGVLLLWRMVPETLRQE